MSDLCLHPEKAWAQLRSRAVPHVIYSRVRACGGWCRASRPLARAVCFIGAPTSFSKSRSENKSSCYILVTGMPFPRTAVHQRWQEQVDVREPSMMRDCALLSLSLTCKHLRYTSGLDIILLFLCYRYASLIAMAIYASPQKRLTLNEIYLVRLRPSYTLCPLPPALCPLLGPRPCSLTHGMKACASSHRSSCSSLLPAPLMDRRGGPPPSRLPAWPNCWHMLGTAASIRALAYGKSDREKKRDRAREGAERERGERGRATERDRQGRIQTHAARECMSVRDRTRAPHRGEELFATESSCSWAAGVLSFIAADPFRATPTLQRQGQALAHNPNPTPA